MKKRYSDRYRLIRHYLHYIREELVCNVLERFAPAPISMGLSGKSSTTDVPTDFGDARRRIALGIKRTNNKVKHDTISTHAK